MSSHVNVKVDLSGIEKMFGFDAMRAKQAVYAQRVAFDTRKYVPVEEGTLRDSADAASNYEVGQIIWDTPYAKKVYNLDDSRIVRSKADRKHVKKGVKTTINPNAHSHWFEHAKSEKMEDWRKFAAQLVLGKH